MSTTTPTPADRLQPGDIIRHGGTPHEITARTPAYNNNGTLTLTLVLRDLDSPYPRPVDYPAAAPLQLIAERDTTPAG